MSRRSPEVGTRRDWPRFAWGVLFLIGGLGCEQKATLEIRRLGGDVKVDARSNQVVSVNLNGTGTTDSDLLYVQEFQKLEWLILFDTRITDAGMQHLKGLTRLRFLKIDFTGVTDADWRV